MCRFAIAPKLTFAAVKLILLAVSINNGETSVVMYYLLKTNLYIVFIGLPTYNNNKTRAAVSATCNRGIIGR